MQRTPSTPTAPAALLALSALIALCLVSGVGNTRAQAEQKKQNPVLAPIEDDPDLPRVLIIGDSISMGYTLPTRQLLNGVANLHRPPTNCGPTTKGLEHIDDWLGEGKWDVIHFNWGLHDLKYMNDKGALVPVTDGKQQVPVEQYEKNMDKLAQRLKKTGAKLIWRDTTPVPEGAKGRLPEDVPVYNAAAKRVMTRHGIQTHDLYRFAKEHAKEIQQPMNVHFTAEGSKRLAEEVVKVIKAALEEPEN